MARTGNQAAFSDELIPEKYHALRDAKTYAELRHILDRNGKYLSRAIIDGDVSVRQGQCNQWQLRRRKKLKARECDDGAYSSSTCSSSWPSDSNGGGTGRATSSSVQPCAWKPERQLSGERCDDTALRYVRQQCVTQDSSVTGIQWHIDYLDACTQRTEEVKRRFVEKKCYNINRRGVHRATGSVFNVQESELEVFEQPVSGRFAFSKPTIRPDIMDSYPSQLCQEKAEKLQDLIDNLYQLKLEAAELENEVLPRITLTDCSSSPGRNCEGCVGNEENSVQNNNTRTASENNALKSSGRSTSDNHLNISNNNGCYLQPNCNNLKVNGSLNIPINKLYQSEARPP